MLKLEYIISDTDEKLLKNDLLDIQVWVNGMIQGKINQCWKRFKNEHTQKLMDAPDVESIPASKDGFVELVMNRSDYKDRCARDEQEFVDEMKRVAEKEAARQAQLKAEYEASGSRG